MAAVQPGTGELQRQRDPLTPEATDQDWGEEKEAKRKGGKRTGGDAGKPVKSPAEAGFRRRGGATQ